MKQTIRPSPPPDAWNPEALYLKAQRYAERLYKPDIEDWEKSLWSGLSLEHLARAALANVSPALLAEAKGEKTWQNLLSSLGFTPTESKFSPKSIAVTEVFIRLATIFPDFTRENESFCALHTGKRNSELHSGEAVFEGVALSTWQPKFFLACQILLATMGLELKDFIGVDEAAAAQKLIDAAADKSANDVKGDVAAHGKVWAGKSADEQKAMIAAATAWATRQAGHRVHCPACGSMALVQGEPIGPSHRKLHEDEIVETQEYLPINFECVACGLKILGLSKLSVVGLGERFKRTNVYDAAEFYAPEDQYQGFDDDNNEPA